MFLLLHQFQNIGSQNGSNTHTQHFQSFFRTLLVRGPQLPKLVLIKHDKFITFCYKCLIPQNQAYKLQTFPGRANLAWTMQKSGKDI